MTTPRHFGLDAVRATAIALVLACHVAAAVWPGALPAGVGLMLGGGGVALFFALSGYLIGGALLREMPLIAFWARRWLRTLPAYVVVLALLCWVRGAWDWRYLAFAQTADPHALVIFRVSWSLCVEEWFYLLFPLAVLAARRRLPAREAFLAALVAFLAVPVLLRAAVAICWPDAGWQDVYAQQVPLRLDAPAVGLLMAWTRRYRADLWARVAGRWRSLAAGLVGIVGCWAWGRDAVPLPLFGVAFPTLLGVSCAALVCWAARFAAPPAWASPVQWLARISYALYLVHLTVCDAVPALGAAPVVAAAVVVGVSVVLATALHVLVERPGMAMRAWASKATVRAG